MTRSNWCSNNAPRNPKPCYQQETSHHQPGHDGQAQAHAALLTSPVIAVITVVPVVPAFTQTAKKHSDVSFQTASQHLCKKAVCKMMDYGKSDLSKKAGTLKQSH